MDFTHFQHRLSATHGPLPDSVADSGPVADSDAASADSDGAVGVAGVVSVETLLLAAETALMPAAAAAGTSETEWTAAVAVSSA